MNYYYKIRKEAILLEYVIKNINIVTLTGDEILYNYDVMISEHKIVDIKKNISSMREIDGTGKYLIPGLADMHYHTEAKSEIENQNELKLLIANGVTTIRIMWGSEHALELKSKQYQDDFMGPQVYVGSRILDGNPPVFEGMRVVESIEDARRAVKEAVESGYDFLKVYNNLLMPQYLEILDSGKKYNLDIIGHVPVDVGCENALNLGQYGFEHSKAIPKHLLFKAAKMAAYFDPTLITMKAVSLIKNDQIQDEMYHEGVAKYVDANTIKEWKENVAFFKTYDFKFDRTYQEYVADIKKFHDAGGFLLTGTDTPMPFCVPGFALHEELQIFSEAGIDNGSILRAATINAAKSNHWVDEVGSIEGGKIANLVILNSNPIENIKNTMDIDAVILRGKYINRDALDLMLGDVKTYCQSTKDILKNTI